MAAICAAAMQLMNGDRLTAGNPGTAEIVAVSWNFFDGLPEEKRAFFHTARRKYFSRTEILWLQGDAPISVFYVQEGKVSISQYSDLGKEVVFFIHNNGALIGLPDAMANKPRVASAISLTESIVYEIGRKEFYAFIAKYPELTERTSIQLHGTINFILAQLLSALSDSAEIRLKKLLGRLYARELLHMQPGRVPDLISIDIPLNQLAGSIGISRQMISQLLSRMQKEGLLSKSIHKISLLKPEHFLSYLEVTTTLTHH